MRPPIKLLLLLVFFGKFCNGQYPGDGPKNTIILHIQKKKNDYLYLDYYNHLNIAQYITIENKDFVDTVITLQSQIPLVIYNASIKRVPYLLYPNERLQITTKGHDILITSNKPERDAEFKLIQNLRKKYNSALGDFELSKNKKVIEKIKNEQYTLRSIDEFIDSAYKVRMNFIDSVALVSSISKSYRKFYTAYLNFLKATDKILFSQLAVGNSAVEHNSHLYNLKPDSVYDNYLAYKFYRNYLNGFSYILQKQRKVENYFSFASIIDSVVQGKSKDFLLFNYITKNLGLIKNDSLAISHFFSYCKDDAYKKYVEDLLSQNEGIENEAILTTIKGGTLPFNKILSENTNKLIYIDIWASWCGPCVAEFKNSFLLKEKYKGKNIVFLYLSLDKSKTEWQLSARNFGSLFSEKNSFLVKSNFNSSFAKEFKISSIPRYILVGKDGKIISSDCFRPSDPELIRLIDFHLKH